MVYAYYPNRRGLLNNLEASPSTEHYFPRRDQMTPEFLALSPRSQVQITQDTPIASIGSCFAREIRQWLIKNNYLFIQTATGAGTGAGSARYDRVYSTFSIRQEFERAFGTFEPLINYWEVNENGTTHLLDPYRYTIAWDNHKDREEEQADHKKNVYQAFTTAKVLIITVGQGEVWYDQRDGSVFPALPPLEIYDPKIHKLKISTFQENLDNLRACLRLIQAHNPDVHLIITTSPVPLKVTFTQNNSVVANTAMKSMLRAVVDEFVSESGSQVSYFPAYELVTSLIPNAFTADGRHVEPSTVNVIMQYFEEFYVQKKSRKVISLEDLVQLRKVISWNEISTKGELLDVSADRPQEYLQYLDLMGEAYLFSNREEEATDRLLQARTIHQRYPHFQSTQSLVTRNHLLLVSLDYTEEHLITELALELAAEPQRPTEMLINGLDAIKRCSKMNSIRLCTRLLNEVKPLPDFDTINKWLEATLQEIGH